MPDFQADTSIFPQSQPNALLGTAQGFVGLANAAKQNQLLGVDVQQAHQNLVQQQVGTIVDAFSSLATNPNVGYGDFVRVGSTLLKQGVISPQTYQAELANLPKQGDPATYQGIANGYLSRALDAGSRFSAEYGYGAGAGAGQMNYTNEQGQPVSTNTANYARETGYSSPMGAAAPNPMTAAPSGVSGGVPVGNALLGASPPAVGDRADELRAATGAPAGAVPLAQVASPPARPAGAIVAPSPQQQAQFNASSKQQQDDLTADAGYTSNIVPLSKVIQLLPQTTTGLGSKLPSEVAQVFSTFGIPIGNDQAKNISEVQKYTTQLARAAGAAPNSDAQLAAAFAANPNVDMNNAAATDVAKVLLSLNRMQHAKVLASQAAGVQPQDYSKFASQWGSQQDPRAYGFDLMTPDAKAALKTELKANPAEAAKFVASYQTAQQLGILGQ